MARRETGSVRRPSGPLPIITIILGALVFAVGLWLVGAYVFGAIISRIGEPDQSLLFWYLPLLFIGIAALVMGGAAIVLGVIWRRRKSA